MAKHRTINAHLRSNSRVDANGASARPGALPRLRCAIYTRKSSEEGLEQDFNSLHAQREACEAHIASQRHEGWMLLPERYDDGGYSGGTLDRPALKRLMSDVEAGRIDIVVVYKVDRLTRSLADFAKIIEIFDTAGGDRNGPPTSFVSVTQSFNTTSSMGRLTLNVLLSFAQFEREVTGERIRDKIAASKKKGLWMGGAVPMGYRPDGRTLVIVEPDATRVRSLFERYLHLGTVTRLADELAAAGERTPLVTAATGRSHGGRPFSRGHLYAILTNPIYIGEIDHKGTRHPGQHAAIVDRDLWDRVQASLADNTYARHAGTNTKNPSLLVGLLYDASGNRLTASHATKGDRRYRYYQHPAALKLVPGGADQASSR
jgi:site-specific DNA recombinase